MYQVAIDRDLCKKDGLCARTCALGIIEQREKRTVPKIVRVESCIACGQCAAICRHGALSHSEYPEDTTHPIQSELVPTYDQVMELFRSRRSKRNFKDKPVEKESIEKVLEAARFAPSGHNKQSTEFIVVLGKESVRKIATMTADYLSKMTKDLGNPIGRTMFKIFAGRRTTEILVEMVPELEGAVAEFHKGTKDYLLNDAPALVFFCADTTAGYPSENANLAIQNAALAAETLGLGCFYAGFVLLACNRDDHIPKHISLPETHKVYGALALGHPRVKFKRWPDRKPARITWMGAN